jgi:hypothetical protein
VPSATVRGWLRRLRSRAEDMRRYAMGELGAIGGTGPVLPAPAASPLGDALNAVAAAAHAAIAGHGFARRACGRCWAGLAWPATSHRPARADHFPPARALACPQPGRGVHHDHHGVTRAAQPATVSTTPTPRAPTAGRAPEMPASTCSP